jgi:hypothetical protein
VSDWHSQWLTAIRAMTAAPEDAAKYLDRRLRFTTEVARALSHDDSGRDSLVYGVWLERHQSPVYIGQTTEGRRRLWDLPIGESHHLANSFPPEVWDRVAVVYWVKLLDARPELFAEVAAALKPLVGDNPTEVNQSIGLGLEFLLQHTIQPLFNRRKKRRDGTWRTVEWQNSESLGARTSPHLASLFTEVFGVWQHLAAVVPAGADVAVTLTAGRVVFPGRIRELCQGEKSNGAESTHGSSGLQTRAQSTSG